MNKIVRKFGFFLLVIFIIPIVFYIINFKSAHISNLSSDWGTFGDFIGGITNPIIGIANALILIYLTLKISEFDQKQKEKELKMREFENKNALMLIGFKELNSYFIKLVKLLANHEMISQSDGISLKFEFQSTIMPYLDMFDTLNDLERTNLLANKLLDVHNTITKTVDSLPIIQEFTELLSDLRIEINSMPSEFIQTQ